MKIAILGNMNNNGFALMRYMRDLGVNADLIMFLDDGNNHSSHFSIESDTWDFDKWKKFIIDADIVNSYAFPLQRSFFSKIIFSLLYFFRVFMKKENFFLAKPTGKTGRKDFIDLLEKYDVYIGSGATPAIFESLEKNLTVFMAYSLGIEYIEEEYFLNKRNSKNFFTRYFAKRMYELQAKGLRNTKILINSEFTSTKKAYKKLNLDAKACQIPVVYFEKSKEDKFSKNLKSAIKKINSYKFKIISHARHQWVKPKGFKTNQWKRISKNNQMLLYGFKDFIERTNKIDSILCLFEYGEDFLESKKLCKELRIESNIIWLPKMQRKEIIELIRLSSVGVGEFYDQGVIWGGTGWEILGAGKPLIQKFSDKSLKEFQEEFHFPAPPILQSNTILDISANLEKLYKNEDLTLELGRKSSEWFAENNAYSSSKHLISMISNYKKDL